MRSQQVTHLQWENRLVLILTESPEMDLVDRQVGLLKEDLKALKERKLLLIHAIPGKQRLLLPKKSAWKDSGLYRDKSGSKESFEVLLIGLDGGVKLRQNTLLGSKKLFDLIDSMPMRQAEMRRKNK